MPDVINICLKRIPMESRKHDYKNRTPAAARLRKELEVIRKQKPVACHGFGQDTQHKKRLSFCN